jgi:hydroxymethylpyrimidine pyrophosphatase-like HAD family hydrolase
MNKSPLNISKKLIIFDINPNNDDITKELIYGKISSAIKKASLRHHVAFLSHSNLFLLKRMVQDIGITNNYIISDAGARIYNSETNKIIFENKIELQTALSISHFGIIKENLLLISSTTHEVVYSPNLVYEDILEKKHYIKLRRIASFTSLVKFLNDNNVFSIMI